MQPKIYSVTEHDIDPKSVDADALYVLERLKEEGFLAYLVGGSVRDLLLKRAPKDFDISTSALPEDIKRIFQRRCLLIGRRFRLAHIRFGSKIIEVSTFRSGENAEGLILQDNEWGTPEQDVIRRDFTINGLFYDPSNHTIIDYVGGWEDIHANLLRTIGVPEVRFKQDPVRMIRLLKFRARFGFEVSKEARKALIACRAEILKSSQARVVEEILRMLESGASAPFFNLLMESGLLALLFPMLANFLRTPQGKQIYLFLSGVDLLNKEPHKINLERPLLMACLLFSFIEEALQKEYLEKGLTPHIGEVLMLIGNTVGLFEKESFARFPRRLIAIMISILSTQYRLTPLGAKKGMQSRILRYKEFPLALTFLKIRAMVNKDLIPTYTNWKSLHRQHRHHGEKAHGHHHHPSHQDHQALPF